MRTLLCICLTVTLCIISGCIFITDAPSTSGIPTGEKMSSEISELQGAHYAKLNSIGCLQNVDMEKVRLADRQSDFDTIDNLVREKRCFVLPTDTDIFIKDRNTADIVSAKLRGSTQLFYTMKRNLVSN
jgi:hypothetical protein